MTFCKQAVKRSVLALLLTERMVNGKIVRILLVNPWLESSLVWNNHDSAWALNGWDWARDLRSEMKVSKAEWTFSSGFRFDSRKLVISI